MQFQDQSQPWHTTGSQDFQFRQGKNLPGTMGPFTQKIFLQQVKKYFFLFFALIKKTFLQNLVEIIFRYYKKIFLDFWKTWDPPSTKKKKREKLTYGVLGIKIG